jgi:hypothetical protein
MEDLALQPNESKPTILVGNRPGFKNQGVIKAAARQIVLEALTAFKGGKIGKKGLLVKAMDELNKALDQKEVEGKPLENVAIRARKDWAIEQVLKLANGMTKDDKASGLEELLKGGSNVQINFNTHFSQRSGSDRQTLPTVSFGPAQEGFTPPPGAGG